MKKKLVLVLLLATLLVGGAFAQTGFLSAGGGISITPSFGTTKTEINILGTSTSTTTTTTGFDFGIHGFFDVKYAEISLGLLFGSQKGTGDEKAIDTTTLNLGLVGKYPFSINDSVVFFPFAGIDYNINLSARYDGEEIKDEGGFKKADMFDALSILLGIGFDFNITESIFIRADAAYGIVLNSKAENDMVNNIKDMNSLLGEDSEAKVTVSKGKIPIKLLVGFRF